MTVDGTAERSHSHLVVTKWWPGKYWNIFPVSSDFSFFITFLVRVRVQVCFYSTLLVWPRLTHFLLQCSSLQKQ